MKPTWMNTLSSTHKLWGAQYLINLAARNAGYPFYEWNECIYSTESAESVCLMENMTCYCDCGRPINHYCSVCDNDE